MTKSKSHNKVVFFIIALSFLFIASNNIIRGFTSIVDNDEIDSKVNTIFGAVLMLSFIVLAVKDKLYVTKLAISIILFAFLIYLFFSYALLSTKSFVDVILSFALLILWIFMFVSGMIIAKSNHDILDRFSLNFSVFVLVPIVVITLFYYATYSIASFRFGGNDVIFSVIVFFPFALLLEKNKVFRGLLIILFLIISLLSYKRSIIISSFLLVFVFYVLSSDLKSKLKHIFSWRAIAFLSLVIFLYIKLKDILADNLFRRFDNLKSDGGGNRDIIYEKLINEFKYSSSSEILFGHGYQSTRNVTGLLAHNDTLQILFDFGVVGLVFYFIFIFLLLKLVITKYKNRKQTNTLYAGYTATLFSFMFLTQTNCFIYSPYLLSPLMFVLGIMYFRLKAYNNIKLAKRTS